VIVLRGGQSEKQRRDIAARLAAIPQAEERVIVATGRYLGEGFDDSRVPVLARMAAKRRIGYQAIGYKILGTRDLFSGRVLASNLLAEATR
jgi:hypothetical protein